MPSRNSYQCSSMQDDEDDEQGLSPTSIYRRRKRNDFSDEEDYTPSEEEEKADDDEEDEDEEEEEDHTHLTNAEYKGRLCPSPTPLAMVRVATPPLPAKKKLGARMSTGGKTPRRCFVSRNPVANLNRKEYMHVPAKDLPGEWDRHLPKREKRIESARSGSRARRR